MGKKTVALLQTDVINIEDIAGAPRFFIDIFRKYHLQDAPKFNLLFLTDKNSCTKIKKNSPLAPFIQYILPLRSPRNRFNNLVANLDILSKIIFHRIKLLHICQYYHVTHYRRLKFIQSLPPFIRPKIVINWIHCNFPYEYFEKGHPYYEDHHARFDSLFKEIKIDGIYSWYELFKIFTEKNNLIKSKPRIHPIKTYCCDTEKFKPASVKENVIVWAARFDKQKRPLMFIEAVNILHNKHASEIKNWKFYICGKGPEKEEIANKIMEYQLANTLELKDNISDMAPVFARSKCYVSTQDYENFTSLSMNEALASGNAIVSRNVGQTGLYVQNGYNGFLAEQDSSEGIANALWLYISSSEKHTQMKENSINLSVNIHTPENFIKEIDEFWEVLIN